MQEVHAGGNSQINYLCRADRGVVGSSALISGDLVQVVKWLRRALLGAVVSSVGVGSLLFAAPSASAAVSPVADRPAEGVTADALPTLQLDNPDGKSIVWTQTILGNTVYAGGTFSNVRPAGAAAGTNLTARGNLVAYDITTGNLVSGFAPVLNTTVRALATSPDGKRLYVGGAFTTANGQNRYRLAAYDLTTGALISTFAPNLNATVTTIVATATTVYVGGYFGTANGSSRTRLAAFQASNGALTTWAPTADYDVNAMVLTPDKSKIVIGGGFQNVNGAPVQGVGALDPATGASVPWPVNQVIHNGNAQSGIYSLSTDSDTVYGTNYNFGTGNYEGPFAMNQDGSIKWLADCHGDSYAAFSADNGIVYGGGHAHYCSNIGGFPESNPRKEQRLYAVTRDATGTVQPNGQGGSGYGNFAGQPSPSLINYFPQFASGTASGKTQAVWSLTGNKQYLAAGGEFPTVNGTAQYGLVRFAVPAVAPNKVGPTDKGGTTNPSVVAIGGYGARLSWKLNWDYDDTNLTYKVVRADQAATPLFTTTRPAFFWNRPFMTFMDKTAQAGQTYRYRLITSDPKGNTTQSDYVSITMPTTSLSDYGKAVLDDGAANYWRLGDGDQPTLTDLAGGNSLTKSTGVTAAADGAINGDADGSTKFDGTTAGSAGTSVAVPSTDTFTAEAWIKTTSITGGKVLGFGNKSTGSSTSYDRQVYMNNSGRLTFGVSNGGVKQTITTSGEAFNDGAWHHIVAQLSPAGTVLWVDGVQKGSNPSATKGQAYTGFWRLGGDNLSGWVNRGSSDYFAGQVDDVAIYPTALTLTQVRDHYSKSGRSAGVPPAPANAAPVASFTTSCTERVCAFDGSASADPDGTVSTYAWSFGDGTSSAEVSPSHTYAADGTYPVTLTVTDNLGKTNQTVKQVTAQANQRPTAGITTSCTTLSCVFDGSSSADADGTIASYAWDFGDGGSATEQKPPHTFTAAGTYSVTLTVTDDKGATGSTTKSVTVSAANAGPTASFTSTCPTLTCSFDAAGSSDSDGTVASYDWDFGDGTTGTGKTATRTYAAGGTFSVKLTVTDDAGATDSTTKAVTVTGPVSNTVAADQFSRSGTGWGTANTGGAWTLTSSSPFSTNGSNGQVKLGSAGASLSATLNSTSATNATITADFSADKAATGSGTFANLVARKSGNSFYTMKVRWMADGTMHLVGTRTTGGTETTLREVAVSGLTYTPGTVLRAKFVISGTTTTVLSGKVWTATGTEPGTQLTVTDSTAPLTSAGSVGTSYYLGGTATNAPVTVSVDNFTATKS